MSSIVDERGFNQGYSLSDGQRIRLRRRAAAIVEEMKVLPDPRAPWRILELGCGTGELAAELVNLADAHVTAIDLSKRFIAEAKAKHQHERLEFRDLDLLKPDLDLESDRYDFIVGNGVLHHLYDALDTLLPKLRNLLLRHGKLIFWEPNLLNPYVFLIFTIPNLRRLARLEPSEMAFTPHFIREKLMRAGFADVRCVTRDFLIPHIPISIVNGAIKVGDWLEHSPLRSFAQSVFISATKST